MQAEQGLEVVQGEPSWRLAHGAVELYVTVRGGHMAPVRFDLGDGRHASPYSMPPWEPRECPEGTPPLLQVLRGDFFCLPFGVSKASPHPHGATANGTWSLRERGPDRLLLELHDPDLGARVEKEIRLVEGQRAVYQRHTVHGLKGHFNFGHHPIMQFPEDAGPCAIRTGPIKFGQVYPGDFEQPAMGGYSSLKPGARFTSLGKVQLANGGDTSLAEFPAREGFEDLVLFAAADPVFGWTAVHFPGYVWLALRNTTELPATLLWHSNGGRHYPPWNGRHRRRLGVEDVCSHFHDGLEISREDRFRTRAIATTLAFAPDKPRFIRHIQLVQPLPPGFTTVESVARDALGESIRLNSRTGGSLTVPVDWRFLYRDED